MPTAGRGLLGGLPGPKGVSMLPICVVRLCRRRLTDTDRPEAVRDGRRAALVGPSRLMAACPPADDACPARAVALSTA